MGYRIIYGKEPENCSIRRIRLKTIAGYTAVCFALFGLLTVKFWPEGREVLEEMMLPGDPAVTRQALQNMVSDLKEGEAIGDAVAAFCREIVDGAQLSD